MLYCYPLKPHILPLQAQARGIAVRTGSELNIVAPGLGYMFEHLGQPAVEHRLAARVPQQLRQLKGRAVLEEELEQHAAAREDVARGLQPASDVFSCGCVLLELFLEDGPPFELPQLLRYTRGEPMLDGRLAKVLEHVTETGRYDVELTAGANGDATRLRLKRENVRL